MQNFDYELGFEIVSKIFEIIIICFWAFAISNITMSKRLYKDGFKDEGADCERFGTEFLLAFALIALVLGCGIWFCVQKKIFDNIISPNRVIALISSICFLAIPAFIIFLINRVSDKEIDESVEKRRQLELSEKIQETDAHIIEKSEKPAEVNMPELKINPNQTVVENKELNEMNDILRDNLNKETENISRIEPEKSEIVSESRNFEVEKEKSGNKSGKSSITLEDIKKLRQKNREERIEDTAALREITIEDEKEFSNQNNFRKIPDVPKVKEIKTETDKAVLSELLAQAVKKSSFEEPENDYKQEVIKETPKYMENDFSEIEKDDEEFSISEEIIRDAEKENKSSDNSGFNFEKLDTLEKIDNYYSEPKKEDELEAFTGSFKIDKVYIDDSEPEEPVREAPEKDVNKRPSYSERFAFNSFEDEIEDFDNNMPSLSFADNDSVRNSLPSVEESVKTPVIPEVKMEEPIEEKIPETFSRRNRRRVNDDDSFFESNSKRRRSEWNDRFDEKVNLTDDAEVTSVFKRSDSAVKENFGSGYYNPMENYAQELYEANNFNKEEPEMRVKQSDVKSVKDNLIIQYVPDNSMTRDLSLDWIEWIGCSKKFEVAKLSSKYGKETENTLKPDFESIETAINKCRESGKGVISLMIKLDGKYIICGYDVKGNKPFASIRKDAMVEWESIERELRII